MNPRTAARERAMGLLYEAGQRDQPVAEVVAELPVEPDPYAVALVEGASEAGIDDLIERHSTNWSLARMPEIDLTVLRIAVWELTRDDVPTPVVIDEAVDLAKRFSTDDSGRFVNGVLSAVAADVRPD